MKEIIDKYLDEGKTVHTVKPATATEILRSYNWSKKDLNSLIKHFQESEKKLKIGKGSIDKIIKVLNILKNEK